MLRTCQYSLYKCDSIIDIKLFKDTAMLLHQDLCSIQQDAKQLDTLGQNGKNVLYQTVPSMSYMRCSWYQHSMLPPRVPAPLYENERKEEIAIAYDVHHHDFPKEGLIYDSYQVFMKDVVDQFYFLSQYLQFIPSIEQYKTSNDMRDDLRRGKLRYLPTEETWEYEDKDYYMYNTVQVRGKTIIINDMFRIVHDAFAHSAGFSFNSYGEYFSWWVHRDSIRPLGRYALFCETRAQNIWTNHLPQHADLPVSERPFPRPKAVLYDKSIV